jgi:hypothetical protein
MLKSDQSPAPTNHIVGVHTTEVLRALIDEAPRDEFTLRWLIGSLPHRSFGAILVFLGVIAMVPVVSIPAGLLITVLAVQIVLGYRTPMEGVYLCGACTHPGGGVVAINGRNAAMAILHET